MIQKTLSTIMILVGLLLMSVKITSDSEPGAIPLLLVAVGTVWLLVARSRSRN